MALTIDFELSDGDNTAALLLIAESLDEIIAEAIAGKAIDAGDSEILAYHIIVDE